MPKNITPNEGHAASRAKPVDGWSFLSSHAQVLLSLGRAPERRLREVAAELGLTERSVQGLVSDLERARYLTRVRVGRRNRYEIHSERHMRHPLVAHNEITALLNLLGPPSRD